jgi:repressor of nif and glnA expression
MSTELEVLKKILNGKDKTPVRSISSHLGYGTDYIRFICQKLAERDLIKCLGRNWYKITAKGQKELERRGLIKKRLKNRGLKIENPVWDRVQIPVIHPSKIVKLKSELAEPKIEKLRLGKKIEKAASFLRKLRIF